MQALHGAIGSLPALALVFASDISQVAPGAPLFAAAIILVIGAYVHWNSTDTVFWMTSKKWLVADDAEIETADDLRDEITALGHRHVALNYAYAIATLACSVAGFAGVYSTLRTGISPEAGFIVVAMVLVGVSVEVIISRRKLTSVIKRIQDIVIDRV